jgi:hypothetical protein
MSVKEEIHKCGNGFRGIVKVVKRPGVGVIKFCEFCGKEFKLE